MNLTFLLLLFAPLLLIPSFLLPSNKVRMYLIPSFTAFFFVVVTLLTNTIFPELYLEEKIGSFFLPMSHFLYRGYIELSQSEIYHLSFSFFLLLLFAVVFLVIYLPVRFFFIGTNPSIRKPMRYITKVFLALSLFFTLYFMACCFFINIRLILPFPDGFLEPLFSIIYPIEA